MRNQDRIVLLLVCVLLTTLVIGPRGHASQSSSDGALNRNAMIGTGKTTAVNAFVTALRTAGVPGGIAAVSQCGDDRQYVFSASGPTLEDVLRNIESTDRRYTWNIINGLVNILPVEGDPSLLKLRIKKLHINNVSSIDEAANQLFSAQQVRNEALKLRLTPGLTRIGMSDLKRVEATQPAAQQHDLTISDLTVRESLSAISRANGKAVWEYRERHCNGKAEFQVQFVVR